jgi:hypothetical protein
LDPPVQGCRAIGDAAVPPTSVRENNIKLELIKFGRDLGVALGASLCPAIFDRDITTLSSTKFAQPLHKGGSPLNLGCGRVCTQKPDSRQPSSLLRAHSIATFVQLY